MKEIWNTVWSKDKWRILIGTLCLWGIGNKSMLQNPTEAQEKGSLINFPCILIGLLILFCVFRMIQGFIKKRFNKVAQENIEHAIKEDTNQIEIQEENSVHSYQSKDIGEHAKSNEKNIPPAPINPIRNKRFFSKTASILIISFILIGLIFLFFMNKISAPNQTNTQINITHPKDSIVSNTKSTPDATVIYKNTVNSTVTIETDIALGSGFVLGDGVIVTNYHVIKGAKYAYCYTANSIIKYDIQGYIVADETADLILLKACDCKMPGINWDRTSSDTNVQPGQKVYVIGSPKGLPATISDGIVSGLRTFDNHQLLQITAPISHGSSGGPVLNSKGELIGVSVGQFREGQNLNFAIPKSYLYFLLCTFDFLNYEKTGDIYFIASLENKKKKLVVEEENVDGIGKVVMIGTQVWTTVNLNSSSFRNGDPIPEAETDSEWSIARNTGKPAWCYKNGNLSNEKKYGKLYNWYAVHDKRGLAPFGWHIPSDNDWTALVNYLGVGNVYESENKMKSTSGREYNGNNMDYFTVHLAGCRDGNGIFGPEETGGFWSSTEYSTTGAWSRGFLYSSQEGRDCVDKGTGFSVRCVKD